MGMVVQHNMNAINSYNKLNANVAGMKKSSEKLSSGYRINRAGDDAAGLAVSEKMRSQIKGLNQAIRNSQDGINMIQTFEGAAQETHSILQRMKELASQSANGTYDDPTDRAALQLEFDQLNDELNQIADTDFNGTVVLNGGVMADGLKAVDGEFNYANYIRDKKQLSADDVSMVSYQVLYDDPITTGGKTKADTLWNDVNATWNRGDAATANDGPDSFEVTFKYDAAGGNNGSTFWSAISATNGADQTKLTVASTSNGGFSVSSAGVANAATVVLDQTKLVNGDTITLNFKNPVAGAKAPTNFGSELDTTLTTYQESTAGTAPIKLSELDLTVAAGANATDSEMSEALAALYETLDGAKLKVVHDATALAAADSTVSLITTDPNGNAINQANATADGDKITIKKGTQTYEFGIKTTAAGVTTITDWDTAANKSGTKVYLTLTQEKPDVATATSAGTGDVVWNISLQHAAYDSSAKPSVEVSSPINSDVSKSNSFTNSTARMTYTDSITLQTGARTKDSVNFTFNYNADKSADMGELKANLNLSARADGLNTANLSLATQEDANKAIDQIDKAINKTSMVRASFGSIQNRLEHKITNLTTTSENLTEAESSIRDTDMASEMMNYTKFNILQQAAQSMLAQANQQPQSILQLLG